MKRCLACILIIGVIFMTGCSVSDDMPDGSEENSMLQQTHPEDTEITIRSSYPSDISNHEKPVYRWLYIESSLDELSPDRQSEQIMEQVNARLEELGIDGLLEMVQIQNPGWITKERLGQIEKTIGAVDFVTFSSYQASLSETDWGECFIDLTSELTSGRLKEFYELLPPEVWEANRISEGQYNFASGTEVNVPTIRISQPMLEEEKETLEGLSGQDLLEMEEGLAKYCDQEQRPLLMISGSLGLQLFQSYPYVDSLLSNVSCGWGNNYFVPVMGPVGYNRQTGQIENMYESDTLKNVIEQLRVYLDQGYGMETMRFLKQYGYDQRLAANGNGIAAHIMENCQIYNELEGEVAVIPLTDQGEIQPKEASQLIYSCVRKHDEEKEGWQEVLNALGSDEKLTYLLNFGEQSEHASGKQNEKHTYYLENDVIIREKNPITISAILYPNFPMLLLNPLTNSDAYANMYSYWQETYRRAEPSPLLGFVMDPTPVQKELEEMNQALNNILGITNNFTAERVVDESNSSPIPETVSMISAELWDQYLENIRVVIQNNGGETVEAEVQRQFSKWGQRNEK